MKNNAIVANMGHYPEGEIDMKGLAAVPGLKRVTIKPQVRPLLCLAGGSARVVRASQGAVQAAAGSNDAVQCYRQGLVP